jgi:hypothetical protein
MLTGNTNQYGDYDECLNSISEHLRGKYCLADIQIHAHDEFKHLWRLLTADEPYTSKFNDVGHVVPKKSSLKWAFCVPSACSHQDVEIAFKNKVHELAGDYYKVLELSIKSSNCRMKDENYWKNLSAGTIITS